MLKSTYKSTQALTSLPEGWTEHKAPTGHSYYYNSNTKESTYTRPGQTQQPPEAFASSTASLTELNQRNGLHDTPPNGPFNGFHGYPSQAGGKPKEFHEQRPQRRDRPKSKHAIPGCEPWLLVNTRLGRRFVYNPEKNQSFWRFPADVMKGVIEYDKLEREKREDLSENHRIGTSSTQLVANLSANEAEISVTRVDPPQPMVDSDGEEYEEVEVTDDDEEHPTKRLKEEQQQEEDKPVEFDEDDIAYQLAAMGDEYGLEADEYGGGHDFAQDVEDGGLPITEEDSKALFKDMLEDYHISPYTTWDTLIEIGQIVEDDRYTVLPNMRSRREVWGEWSRETIQTLKEQRAKEEKKDPRIAYFAFLESKATPKLYWPEFRRKYQKEPEMRNTKTSDKDREKWYREHVNRLKLPESTLKSDFISLLTSTPLHCLNRSSSLDSLPSNLLSDLRYISLRPALRQPLLSAHIESLPAAPARSQLQPEEEAAQVKQRQERKRREHALTERQQRVDDQKRKQQGALQQSREILREGEAEVERAMKFGRIGLKGHMELDQEQ